MVLPRSISRIVADLAAHNPAAPALLAPERSRLIYGRLNAEIQGHAHALRSMGIRRDDRVALLLPNGPEAVVGFLAVSTICACAPLNPIFKVSEIEKALSNLKPKAIIAGPELDRERCAVVAKYGVSIITATAVPSCEAGVFMLSLPGRTGAADDIPLQPNDLALVLQTSGTTAQPKLVGLTHEHLCRSAESIARVLKLTPEDRCLNIMPLFHIHGIVGAVLSSLCTGASVVCSPGLRGRQFFHWLEEFQPSWYTAVPTMHSAIVARAAQRGDMLERNSLRFIRSCSAALPNSVRCELEQRFAVPVLEAYGMTEATHQIACNPLPPALRKAGSVGLAAGVEVAIFNERGRPFGPDCEGEIVIRGASVISGYLGDPSATEQSFTGGWFRTGDIGLIDRDGYIFLKGRSKELINRGGIKISPHEIEEVLLEHSNVAEAVVFAVPDWRLGEEVAAAVVLRHSSPTAANDIREFASRRLSDFKLPRQLVFLPEIPKGPTGKLQRVGLAAKFGLSATPRGGPREGVPIHETRTQLEDVFATMWARIIGVEQVGLNDNFFEIGGDSLAAMELIAGIEQVTGHRLTLAALFQAPTIKQLAALIKQDEPGWLPYIVPIQGSGSRPPFFCVEAGPRYLSLARRLGPDQPFLGLLHPRPEFPSRNSSVEAMAEFSVKSIRAVQPDGPYFLGGWCTAGLIAYEIAQQLRAQDQEVALLVLFDAVNPGRLDKLSITQATFAGADEFCRKVWFHFRSMTQSNSGDLPAYFLERLKNMGHTLTRRTWLARTRASLLSGALRYDGADNMYLTGRRYRPTPYYGRVMLFRRSLRAISKYLDETLGWGKLIVGELRVIQIEGGHGDMLAEPQVRHTADALAACLRDLQEQDTGADHCRSSANNR